MSLSIRSMPLSTLLLAYFTREDDLTSLWCTFFYIIAYSCSFYSHLACLLVNSSSYTTACLCLANFIPSISVQDALIGTSCFSSSSVSRFRVPYVRMASTSCFCWSLFLLLDFGLVTCLTCFFSFFVLGEWGVLWSSIMDLDQSPRREVYAFLAWLDHDLWRSCCFIVLLKRL